MGGDDPKKLRALLDLHSLVDGNVEESLQARRNVAEAILAILPVVCERVGARGAFVRTFNEELALSEFVWPADLVLPDREEIFRRSGEGVREAFALESGEDLVVAQPLDVAGEWFGSAGLVVSREAPSAGDPAHLAASLDVICEQLDNFLYSIRAARERHRVLMELGEALRHRVLGQGLELAVAALTRSVPIAKLLVACVAEEEESTSLHVQLYADGQLEVDTMGRRAPHADERAILDEGRAYLRKNDPALLRRFGFVGDSAREEVLISGVTEAALVGKVLATAENSGFNTYDRELLAGFASFVRQRIVDFNKEWRTLARSFRPEDVTHLLQSGDYARRWLSPREEEVAILYVDIAGFTRLSEQVLKSPMAVADLVEAWSRDAVNLVWEHRGVFDKMVGDCVIALFGPPFYAMPPGERLADAIRCAVAIREMTRRLPERKGFEHLREGGLGVSTGVNLAPLFVGRFGPNDNFTGFSSGMNNTARLQGCATKGEILVMSDVIATLPEGHGFRFGDEQSAKVKNVGEPLRYRALLEMPAPLKAP